MPEQPPTFNASVKAGHDLSVVSSRGVFWFIICFIIGGVIIELFNWGLLGYVVRRDYPPGLVASPLGNVARPTNQPLQPSPGHPTLPWQDLPALRDRDLGTLRTGGGGTTEDAAHQRLPINAAMKLFLDRGGLSTQPAHPADTQPWIIPTPQLPRRTENRT